MWGPVTANLQGGKKESHWQDGEGTNQGRLYLKDVPDRGGYIYFRQVLEPPGRTLTLMDMVKICSLERVLENPKGAVPALRDALYTLTCVSWPWAEEHSDLAAAFKGQKRQQTDNYQ